MGGADNKLSGPPKNDEFVVRATSQSRLAFGGGIGLYTGMRPALLLAALLVLTRCSTVSSYDASSGSPTSQTGNEAGAGVQAPLWSSDPSQKTVTNLHPGDSGQ
jgi:hypothetical protein